MAYVNGTTHYNLPQTVGTDKRDWADTNQAFADIDAALYSATEDVADAQTEINGLKERMTTAEGNITTNANDISALDGRLTTAEGTITQHTAQIADVRQDVEDMICAYNEASATSTHAYAVGDYFIYNDVLYRATTSIGVGDTIVPDTNCTTTNVASELLKLRGEIVSINISAGTTYQAMLNSLYNDLHERDFSSVLLIINISESLKIEYRLCSTTATSFQFANTDYIDSSHLYQHIYISKASNSEAIRHDMIAQTTGDISAYVFTDPATVDLIFTY